MIALESIEEAEAWTAAVMPPANVIAFPAPVVPQLPAPDPSALTDEQFAEIQRLARLDRNSVIKAIRAALKARSGKAWSVTGGTGTAYGWISISAPPARRVDYGLSPEDAAELASLLGLASTHRQGHSVPSSTDFYRVALCRAIHGHAGPFTAEAYWD